MKIHFVACAAFAVLALLSPRALPGEELTPADKAQIAAINAELDKLMLEIMAADEAERAKGKELCLISSDMADKIKRVVRGYADKDPVNLARALEHFMLTNPHFLAKKCGDAFRYPYIFKVFRDFPQENGHRFADFLANPRLSDSEAADLLLAANGYADTFNIHARIPDAVFLRRIAACLKANDPEQASSHRVVLNFHDVRNIKARTCDKAYVALAFRYPKGDFPHEYLYDEKYQTFAQRDPLIAAARDFVAKKLARLDAVDALEKDLREQATLQLSPEEYDSVFKTWRALGGGTAPDAELMLTLDNLFAQAALNAKRAPSDRDRAMTMHLAQRARELLQKDKVEIAPLEESAIRSPDSVWVWFRNPLAVRVYKQRDPLNPHRDVALEKFLDDCESRHAKGELFPLTKERPAPPEKPAAPVPPAPPAAPAAAK